MVNSKQNIIYGMIAIIGVGSIYIIKQMFTTRNDNYNPNKPQSQYLGNPQTDPKYDEILVGGKRKSVKKYRKCNNKTKR
jgi:hypothetical protein